MFWNLSSSSISLATVTPSLVTVGAPHDFSMTTLRPRGPSVTFTALARVLRPAAICARALVSNRISLAAIRISLLLDYREDVILAQNDVFLTVELHFGARVLADEDLVALLHFERAQLAVVEHLAVADGNDFGLERLLFRGVGNEEAAG